jgi:hypothetical protein
MEDVKETWRTSKEELLEVSERTLGYKNILKKDWMTNDIWNLTEKRQNLKQPIIQSKTRNQKKILQKKYSNTDKQIKRSKHWLADSYENATSILPRLRKGNLNHNCLDQNMRWYWKVPGLLWS